MQMPDQQRDDEAIFHIARELTESKKRADYLEQVCAGKPELRERVERLLDMHENEQSLLKTNDAFDETVDQCVVHESAGKTIGRFKLLQEIGEGGFGVVFMAEQLRPVRRKVALKVIKPGMDTKAVVARFEAERQALAMMDHPNIAKVLDGGTTESGRPYFVMELVKGVPINEFCDQQQLRPAQRLDLFVTVCQAVQHAHQKGIIHRDLKPSNILVGLDNDKPIVKVIDFGIAKAIHQQLTEKTLFTAFGQMVGTPQYMSPEQAEISGLDVDTRSDVYSLGVLLYELLTGSTPLATDQLRQAGYAELQRLVKEAETQRPSTRLSTSGEKLTAIAKHRSVEPDHLSALIKGDLDWVVMKALEKERDRRYATPAALADDVTRYLMKEPVEAYPPSAAYKMRKFVRRNRSLVVAGSTFVVVMLAAMMLSWWGWSAAEAAKEVAEYAQEVAERQTQIAETEKKNAIEVQGKLQVALDEKDKALDDYAEELFERGVTAVFSDDEDDLARVREKWGQCQFEPVMLELLTGLYMYQKGRYKEGVKTLGDVYKANKGTRLFAAAYFISLFQDEMDQNHVQEMREIIRGFDWDRDTDRGDEGSGEDRYERTNRFLFGWALIHDRHHEAEQILESTLEGRPWPIARVMYACALAQVAVDDRDAEKAWKAVEEIRKAEVLLPNEVPLAMNIGLWARYHCYWLTKDLNVKAEADELVAKLAKNMDYKNNYHLVANYYKMINSPLLKEVYEENEGDWQGVARSAYFYQVGDYKEATLFLGQRFADSYYARISSACVAAAEGDREQAMAVYEQIQRDSECLHIKIYALDILLLLGESRMASEVAKELDEKYEWKRYWHKVRLRLDLIINNDLSVEELVEKFDKDINESGSSECHGNYLLGLISLAKDDPSSAKGYLEAVIETRQFYLHQYEMAGALLARRFGSIND